MMKSSSDAEDENELKSALLVLVRILHNRTGAERIHIERAWADDEVTRRRRGSVQCFDRAETRPYHKSRTGDITMRRLVIGVVAVGGLVAALAGLAGAQGKNATLTLSDGSVAAGIG